MMSEREQLLEYREKLAKLSEDEKIQRDLYLRQLGNGTIQGPMTGYASLDKPWLKYYDESAIKIKNPNKTIYQFLVDCNKNDLNSIAINYFGKKITYGSLFSKINDVAKAFKALGIKKGDIVTFCAPTLPETIISLYALNKLGAVCNMVDLRTNVNRIDDYVQKTNSNIIIAFESLSEKINQLSEIEKKKIIYINASDSLSLTKKIAYKLNQQNSSSKKTLAQNAMNWGDFVKLGQNRQDVSTNEYKKNMPAVIVYTGGTTGSPKGAMISNDDMNLMALQYKNTGISVIRGQVFMDIMPPFIAYGLVNGIHLPLCCGLTNLLIPKFNPEDFGKLLLKYKPSHFMVVPVHYEFLEKDKLLEGKDLSFIVSPGVGGDTMVPTKEESINEFLRKHGCKSKLKVGYGMTENSSASTLDISNECTKTGSVGIPLVKNTISIFDSNTGYEKKYNETGELYISSPTMMLGYYNNDSETNKVLITDDFGNKWIRSEDIASITENGNVFFKGRKKEIIIRPDGHNVFPDVIEQVISMHPMVKQCCVVGIKSKYNENGLIPTAYVVLNKVDNPEKIIEEIMELQQINLPERDGALEIRIKQELPITAIGKIDFQKIKNDENELSNVDFNEILGIKKLSLKK